MITTLTQQNTDLLGDALQHGHGIDRTKLVHDLGYGDTGADQYLKIAAVDPDPAVRAQAAISIAAVGDPGMLPALRPLIKYAIRHSPRSRNRRRRTGRYRCRDRDAGQRKRSGGAAGGA